MPATPGKKQTGRNRRATDLQRRSADARGRLGVQMLSEYYVDLHTAAVRSPHIESTARTHS